MITTDILIGVVWMKVNDNLKEGYNQHNTKVLSLIRFQDEIHLFDVILNESVSYNMSNWDKEKHPNENKLLVRRERKSSNDVAGKSIRNSTLR